jgi:hypothetical protein
MQGGNELSPGQFGAAFKDFLLQSVAQAPAAEEPVFARRIREHFDADPAGLPVVSHQFETHNHPNLQLALESYLAEAGRSAEILGVSSQNKRFQGAGLSDLAAPGRGGLWGDGGPRPGPVEYVDVPLDADRTLACLEFGLVLICGPEERLAVLVNAIPSPGDRGGARMQVMGRGREEAEAFLAELRTRVRRRNVYRGHVISLEQERYGPLQVRFHRAAEVQRDDIILPAGILERIERQTLDFSRHLERLRAAGQHAKRGLLLHGPPGTGKTLTAKYIASRMNERTVLIPTGGGMRLLAAACGMARLLQPSTVIVEDVDLIAEERTDEQASTALLFELLNQMDGMEEDADVVFLLTTNRPDLLEPALAARPGRVDLAIEIPLPDADCRRRLFELYGRGLRLEVGDLGRFVDRTHNVSAAFIRELVRKAALSAADDDPADLVVRDRHLDDALQELLVEGGELTRSLLGGQVAPPD